MHVDLNRYSRVETASAPNGLALVRNLNDKILPRRVVRHNEQSEKWRMNGSKTRLRSQILADLEVKSIAVHQGHATWMKGGLVPVRHATTKDKEGNPCTTIVAQQERWRRHFTKVLNI